MFIGVWALCGIAAVGILRRFLCPVTGSRRVLGIASFIFVLAGAPPPPDPPPARPAPRHRALSQPPPSRTSSTPAPAS